MKSRDVLLLVAVGAFVLLLAGAARAREDDAVATWTLDRLTESDTARELGLDNSVPSALRTRARGLAVIAAALEADGHRVTSAYRSPHLTAIVRARNAERAKAAAEGREPNLDAINADTVPDPGKTISAHNRAGALDLGGKGGPTTDRAELEAVRDEVLAHRVYGSYVLRALVEGHHVHVEYRGEMLDTLGSEVAA